NPPPTLSFSGYTAGSLGSDGCKPENRDILSDFSESHFCHAKVPVSVSPPPAIPAQRLRSVGYTLG
ncbi:MAG: hypothetical protein J6R67_07675, partial [Treponema sp.]|nr:hypothetical protein [Treponema sp.]